MRRRRAPRPRRRVDRGARRGAGARQRPGGAAAGLAPGRGGGLAAQAHPASERDGIVTVTCASSVWAQELTLMAPDLAARLNAALGSEFVRELRFRAAPAGAWAKSAAP